MEATPEFLELLAASKAILYMLSVLVALYFLGLFKGRWFFVFFLFPYLSFGYDVVLFSRQNVVYESYVTQGGGETLGDIVCSVFSVGRDQQNILIKCNNKLTSNDSHLSMASYTRHYNSEQNIFVPASFGSVYCCPNCSGYPGTLSVSVVSVDESVIPKGVYEESLKGPITDPYGAMRKLDILFDGLSPVGYSATSTPPPGVTPIWDELGNIIGYLEGFFNDLGQWEYKAGYAQLSAETMTALYQSFTDWYLKWQIQEFDFKLTRDQFALYMQSSLARGASIEAAISALAPASSADIATLISAVQTGDGAIVSAINAIPPGGSGGDPATVEIDLSPVVDALGEVKSSVDSLQETGDLPQPSVEDLALDTIPTPEDVVAVQDYYTDWAVSLPGLLGDSANFSLGFLFGSLPAIGSQTSLTLPTLNLPFCPPVTPSFSFPPDFDLSLIRDAFLFLLLIGFAFSAYRIVSSGMNI